MVHFYVLFYIWLVTSGLVGIHCDVSRERTYSFLSIFIEGPRNWTSALPGCVHWIVALPNPDYFHALLCDWLLLSINWEKPCLHFFPTGHVCVIPVLSHLVEDVTGSGNCQHFPYGSFNSSQKAILPCVLPLRKPSHRTLSLSFCHYASGTVEKEWKWRNGTIFDAPSWYFDKSFELSLNSSPMLLWNTKLICVGGDKSQCDICFLSNCLPLNLNSSLCKEKLKWFACPVVLGASLYTCSALAYPD